MLRKCAWCGEEMGEIEPISDKSITHGMCSECLDKQMEKFEENRTEPVLRSLLKSIEEEAQAIEVYTERAEEAKKLDQPAIGKLYNHIAEEEFEHLREFRKPATAMSFGEEIREKGATTMEDYDENGEDYGDMETIDTIDSRVDRIARLMKARVPEIIPGTRDYKRDARDALLSMKSCKAHESLKHFVEVLGLGETIVKRIKRKTEGGNLWNTVTLIEETFRDINDDLAAEMIKLAEGNCQCKFKDKRDEY